MENKPTKMKKLTTIFILSISITICVAQKKSANISNSPYGPSNIYPASVLTSGLNLGLTVDANTKWIEYHNILPNRPLDNYVFLNGTKKVELLAFIPKDDIKNYRYNIIQDDSIYLATNAIPKDALNVLVPHRIGLVNNRVNINLGAFAIENKKLTIETYKITERNKVSTTTIYNKEFKPATILITALGITTEKGQSAVMMENLKDGFQFKLNTKGIHNDGIVNSIFIGIKPTDLTFIYNVYVKNLSLGKTALVSNNWIADYFHDRSESAIPNIRIDASFFQDPGNYEIAITPKLPSGDHIRSFPEKTTTIHFTVLKSDMVYSWRTIVTITLSLILLISTIAGIIIYLTRLRNQKELIEQKKLSDTAQVQLSAVRSQLNPHFLFNALSGIQNLMNKNEIDQANRYLTKFARLTRNVLKSDELINITEEAALLDDYLQMEQLRFGFTYHIDIAKDLDGENTEIPSMLLQPFVENAVKHGIAGLGAEGKIDIRIVKNGKNLELSVTDNGNGFDTSKENTGIGLTLSKKRIALLNTIYKGSPVLLDLKSGLSATIIKITLNQWL